MKITHRKTTYGFIEVFPNDRIYFAPTRDRIPEQVMKMINRKIRDIRKVNRQKTNTLEKEQN